MCRHLSDYGLDLQEAKLDAADDMLEVLEDILEGMVNSENNQVPWDNLNPFIYVSTYKSKIEAVIKKAKGV